MAKNKPEHTINVGLVQITIWNNKTDKGSFKTITINRSYKDGDDWKTTNSLKANDLSLVEVGVRKALEYIYLREKSNETSF